MVAVFLFMKTDIVTYTDDSMPNASLTTAMLPKAQNKLQLNFEVAHEIKC